MTVYIVLWRIPAGVQPKLVDARARLALLERLGPTADALAFKQPFPAPNASEQKPVLDECA
jgi:hypothetical protein